jgi:mersacidin/lichenicidin family type 2 lantibiotic
MQIDVVRAWKDEAYRQSLSEEERSRLPESPVGEIELTDADLEAVYGAQSGVVACSAVCNSVACASVICHSGVCHVTVIARTCG